MIYARTLSSEKREPDELTAGHCLTILVPLAVTSSAAPRPNPALECASGR